MTPENSARTSSNTATWIAGAFGLAIVLGAAFITGFLNWPFRGKPEANKPKQEITATSDRRSTPTRTSMSTTASYDKVKGEAALAKLWAGMDATQLAAITAKWTPYELAPILMRMRTEQVAELLAAMTPERASQVSKEIRELASR